MTLRRAAGSELTPAELYGLLRLRAAVFVVEQDSPYQDPDGRDLLPGTEHLWVPGDGDVPLACLRVLAPSHDGDARRIGRVVTAARSRGRGLAARLMWAALDAHDGERLVLHAQVAVEGFYRAFGFVPDGDEFVEDGIPHVPMVRAGAGAQSAE